MPVCACGGGRYDKNTNVAIKGVVSAQRVIKEKYGYGVGVYPAFRDNRNELTLKVRRGGWWCVSAALYTRFYPLSPLGVGDAYFASLHSAVACAFVSHHVAQGGAPRSR